MPLVYSKTKIFPGDLFDENKATQAVSNTLTRIAKKFKTKTKVSMEVGPHTGHLYRRRRGPGFSRAHRASARFEHPAPDTHNLVNSVEDQKISPTTHEVYVNDNRAPYGKWLEGPKFERAIMAPADVQEFQNGEMQVELDLLETKLFGG